MVSWALVIAGLVLLVVGGEVLVRGATGLARLGRIAPAVVGLTVVAAGTSAPELLVSVVAASRGQPDLAVANVVGSNLFNLGIILGGVALLAPMAVRAEALRVEWPVALGSAAVLGMLALDGRISAVEGGLLVTALVVFVTWLVLRTRRMSAWEAATEEPEEPLPTLDLGRTGAAAWATNGLGVALGIAALGGGSDLLVRGASAIASSFGVPEATIGLTLVAAGTSLPELVASLAAVRQGNHEVAVGNVLGSNIFNVLGIAGITGIVAELPVSEVLLGRDVPWMLGMTVALLPVLWTGLRVSRLEGVLLLGAYGVYTWVLLW